MKKIIVLLIHLGYWMIFLLLLAFIFTLLLPVLNHGSHQGWNLRLFRSWFVLMSGFALIPGLISFYIFYLVLFNRYFVRKKLLLFLLGGVLTVIIASFCGSVYLNLVMGYLGQVFAPTPRAYTEVWVVIAFGALLNGIIGLVIKGFITAYSDIRIKEALNRRNYEVELDLVKSQLNPHFLFNTINNIDVLIGIDALKASMYLNKLSDIMRFMLYETKTERIALDKELRYIDQYLELQKIRTANPDYIRYTVSGATAGIYVPPMLFIPFIENACKHALPRKTGTGIAITLHIEKDNIIFDCRNEFAAKQQDATTVGGLGNELMRKRLQLLYPGRHTLEHAREEHIYSIKLSLYIHEH